MFLIKEKYFIRMKTDFLILLDEIKFYIIYVACKSYASFNHCSTCLKKYIQCTFVILDRTFCTVPK